MSKAVWMGLFAATIFIWYSCVRSTDPVEKVKDTTAKDALQEVKKKAATPPADLRDRKELPTGNPLESMGDRDSEPYESRPPQNPTSAPPTTGIDDYSRPTQNRNRQRNMENPETPPQIPDYEAAEPDFESTPPPPDLQPLAPEQYEALPPSEAFPPPNMGDEDYFPEEQVAPPEGDPFMGEGDEGELIQPPPTLEDPEDREDFGSDEY